MHISEVIECVTILTAVVTIIFTQVNAHKQNKLLLEQSRATMFAEYTRRYQDLIQRMPQTIHTGSFTIEDKEAMTHMRLYFNLCSEEYWLWKDGLIPEKTWNIWLEGMQGILNRKSFRLAWLVISGEYDADFARYFSNTVVDRKNTENV